MPQADANPEAYRLLALAIARNAHERAVDDERWLDNRFPAETPRPIFFSNFESTGEAIEIDLLSWRVLRPVEMSCCVFTCKPDEAGDMALRFLPAGRSLDAVFRTFLMAYNYDEHYRGREDQPFEPTKDLRSLHDALVEPGYLTLTSRGFLWSPRVISLLEARCFPEKRWPGQ